MVPHIFLLKFNIWIRQLNEILRIRIRNPARIFNFVKSKYNFMLNSNCHNVFLGENEQPIFPIIIGRKPAPPSGIPASPDSSLDKENRAPPQQNNLNSFRSAQTSWRSDRDSTYRNLCLCQNQCCGIRDVCLGILIFIHPGSNNGIKRGILCPTLFCRHKYHRVKNYFIFEQVKKKLSQKL